MKIDPSGHWNLLNKVVNTVKNGIKKAANWVNNNIVKPVVKTVKSVASWVNNNIIQPVKNFVNNKIVTPVKQYYNGAKQIINQVVQNINNGYQNITKTVTQAYRQTKQYIQQRTNEIKQKVYKFYCGAAEKLDKWNESAEAQEEIIKYGTYYGDNDKLSTLGFAARHPIIALENGEYISGSTNISTNSTRFSWAFDFKDNDFGIDKKEDEGSERGAIRHTIWQATITNRFGKNIALQSGNAHEKNANALDGISDVYNYKFTDLSKVDEAVDLLNNISGREIGANSSNGATMKEIMGDVLKYYYDQGLNVAIKKDDGYYIKKQTLSKEEYDKYYEILQTLDDIGYSPNDKQNK